MRSAKSEALGTQSSGSFPGQGQVESGVTGRKFCGQTVAVAIQR